MENPLKDVRREEPLGVQRYGIGAQAAVASRAIEHPPLRCDWDALSLGAAAASLHAGYPDGSSRDVRSEAPLVLIVEDEATIAEALQLIIEELGCRVALASNGAAALAIARREPPALVLTDLMMPVMDGRTLVARLREEAARGTMAASPVVVMTAAGRAHARDLDVDHVLRKPFELCEVEELVERLLGERLRRSAGYGV